jgi:hypothetical protein
MGRTEEDQQRARVATHGSLFFPANQALNQQARFGLYTLGEMWEFYRNGLSLGLGIAIGGTLSALLAPRRALLGVVAIAAAVVAAALGYFLIDDWSEGVAGAVGGILGTLAAGAVVGGALTRGGTRGGTAFLILVAALGIAALAFVPAVGYIEAVALVFLTVRARRRRPGRYAGLRSLARD